MRWVFWFYVYFFFFLYLHSRSFIRQSVHSSGFRLYKNLFSPPHIAGMSVVCMYVDHPYAYHSMVHVLLTAVYLYAFVCVCGVCARAFEPCFGNNIYVPRLDSMCCAPSARARVCVCDVCCVPFPLPFLKA